MVLLRVCLLMLSLLQPMNVAHFHFSACTLPLVTISHDAGLSLGEFLLYLVFTTNIFVAPVRVNLCCLHTLQWFPFCIVLDK